MSLSAGALQLAGFLMAHGFWTIADAAPGDRYVPQALCETADGERRLVTFDAPSEDESLAQADTFMGSTISSPNAPLPAKAKSRPTRARARGH